MAEHEAVERGRHCPNKLHRCSRPSHLSKLSLRTGITSLNSCSFFTTSDSQHANNASSRGLVGHNDGSLSRRQAFCQSFQNSAASTAPGSCRRFNHAFINHLFCSLRPSPKTKLGASRHVCVGPRRGATAACLPACLSILIETISVGSGRRA